ncbi:hypothetical protein PTSG_09107 [Salpingoeca rosetta]|uniref:PPM-type phosphatase domain-containing protein n=1 Tax=Salpingoeca rosetta (strain ATCC 50818 / BSB-021) TaxID=946362 RepID=F2UMR2_SALR5|nr:uncharacterized protein PTSG_09107 [Salpingoeca rosetta]EGD78411.1 hypothetical protein PTSG_09107 [Salpingoeca rosetta]|eukprot:XP_004989360.1 hypothetical protein PTSG_09107 [Salpingoeca rosetta]
MDEEGTGQPLAKRAHLTKPVAASSQSQSQSQPDVPSPVKTRPNWTLDGTSGWLLDTKSAVYMDPESRMFFKLDAAAGSLEPCSSPPETGPSEALVKRALDFKAQSKQQRPEQTPSNTSTRGSGSGSGSGGNTNTNTDTNSNSGSTAKPALLRYSPQTRRTTMQRRHATNIMGAFNHGGPLSNVDADTAESFRDLSTYQEQIKQLEVLLRASPGDEQILATINGLKEITRLLEAKVHEGHELDMAYLQTVLKCVKDGFKCTDKNFVGLAKRKKMKAGSTALVAIVNGDSKYNAHVVVANLGDCRAVLCRDGRAVPLSVDHKPSRRDEAKRIKEAGGRVVEVYGISRATTQHRDRYGGAPPLMLAVSRSFGDYTLKVPHPIVSYQPETRIERVGPNDYFLLLACDGVWDVLSNQEAINIAKEHYTKPDEAARAVIQAAYDKRSNDNLTAMVIEFAWNDMHAAKDQTNGKTSSSSGGGGGGGESSAPASDGAAKGKEGGGGADDDDDDDIDDMFGGQ